MRSPLLARVAPLSPSWRRLLATTATEAAAGSAGAAPGRHEGSDDQVKGQGSDSPSSGELYGREDRDPAPSPSASITQASGGGAGDTLAGGATVAKEEGLKDPGAYPIQNDPTVSASPELEPEVTQQLARQQEEGEASGPKAAGQGVVETIGQQ